MLIEFEWEGEGCGVGVGAYSRLGVINFFCLYDGHLFEVGANSNKYSIHTRLHPISRDSGIEIPEAWVPTISQNSRQSYHNGPLTEPFPPLIIPAMPWIETHQP